MGAVSDRVYFNSVVLKVWSLDQQYQHRQNMLEVKFLSPTLDQTLREGSRWRLVICI